ncbi:MAG: hypothetical protein WC656_08270 [Sulfurimonas sp.]|jgi:hypothetical protein
MNIEYDINLELNLKQLEQTIEYAKFRCIPTSELIQKLSEYEAGNFVYDYIGRLNEIKLSNDDYILLIYSIDKLISKYKNLTAKDKTKFENFIRRLIVYLPSHLTHKYFDIFINSTRKTGRKIAYKSICNNLLTRTQINLLFELYLDKKEEEALKAIIYSSVRLELENIILILEKTDKEYWKARLIENFIINQQEEVSKIHTIYPFEFVHAVGRVGNKKYISMIKELFEKNKNDLEFLSIYAYALGKLSAKSELDNLSKYIASNFKY